MAMSLAIALPVRHSFSLNHSHLSSRLLLHSAAAPHYQLYSHQSSSSSKNSFERRTYCAGSDEDSNQPERSDEEQAGVTERQDATILEDDKWDVPWDYGVMLLGLLAWSISYLSTGYASSILADNLGAGRKQLLDLDDQAIYVLLSQVLQTIAGLGAINATIHKYKPLPTGLFAYELRNPFGLQRGWLLWAVIGVLCAGGGVVLTSTVISFVVEDPPAREQDALTHLLPLIGATPFSTASLIIVTGVLAPLLEETVFRGFLLTSLTKRLPEPAAVFLSSAVFALAHLTPTEFPQLFALGAVLGFSYTRTRNLLTPILIHAVWNSGVVLVLTALRLEGYNLRDLLSS